MSPPGFIYFDLGNVLLRFDHRIACRRIAEQTGLDETFIEYAIFSSGLQNRYESGDIDTDEFVAGFVELTECSIPPEAFLEACSDIFQLNGDILSLVAQIKAAGFRIGLLSNTCRAHWEFISLRRFDQLPRLFDVTILSYEHRSMKPDAAIYTAAIAAAGRAPGEIFFTDDRQENVAGGREAGLDATLFRDIPGLIADLRERGVALDD